MNKPPLTEGKWKGGNGHVKDLVPTKQMTITPPPPPPGPENRVECSSCGFIAPASEFRNKHPYCLQGRLLISLIILASAVYIIALGLMVNGVVG